MPIINRLSRLVSADLHAVLDTLEDPEILLTQALREIQETLLSKQHEQRQSNHELERLRQQIDNNHAELNRLDEELDTCLAHNEDTLARTLVRRKLNCQRRIELTETRCQQLSESILRAENEISEIEARLADLKQKQSLVVKPPAERFAPDNSNSAVSNADVEIALLREKQRRQPS